MKTNRSTGFTIVVIVLATLLAGSLANLVHPRRIPWIQDWSRHVESLARKERIRIVDFEAVNRIATEGIIPIFDARPLGDYDDGAIPGALPFPEQEMETWLPQYAPMLSMEDPVVVYCSGKQCEESILLGIFLRDVGYTNILLYPGGYSDWVAHQPSNETRP